MFPRESGPLTAAVAADGTGTVGAPKRTSTAGKLATNGCTGGYGETRDELADRRLDRPGA